MINRYFYQSDIASFLAEDTDTIFGKMAQADEMDTASTQKFAWIEEIAIMKEVRRAFHNHRCADYRLAFVVRHCPSHLYLCPQTTAEKQDDQSK